MGGGLESRCVGRVYGADGSVRRNSCSHFAVNHKVYFIHYLNIFPPLREACYAGGLDLFAAASSSTKFSGCTLPEAKKKKTLVVGC